MSDYQTAITEMENIAVEKRKELGKIGRLRTVTILYKEGNETKRVHQNNLTGGEVLELRNNLFSAGIMLPVSPGIWDVISPWDIVKMTIERQRNYFD